MNQERDGNGSVWRGRLKIAFVAFAIIGGFLLLAEHRAHLAPYGSYLPFLLLAACPLMHVFMHRGHGEHASRDPRPQREGHETASPSDERVAETPTRPVQHHHGGE